MNIEGKTSDALTVRIRLSVINNCPATIETDFIVFWLTIFSV